MTSKAATDSFKSCKLISLALVVLAFHSMLARAATTNELLTVTNSWRYWQGGSLDGVNWKAPDYDDSG